jgi:hypothetical protein
MAEAVYILCSLTSLACAVLLLRSYLQQRSVKLLLWSGLCFVGLTLSNVLLFVDLAVVPHIDLSGWRSLVTLISLVILIYGLIWDAN